jgi:hypothetical protein
MSHPTSCTDPACRLAYVEHLHGIMLSAAATPSRTRTTRTRGLRDESMQTTVEREARWAREEHAVRELDKVGMADDVALADAPALLRKMGG